MTTLVCDEDKRVSCLTGHVFLFKKNIPREIPEHAVLDCRTAGCFPAGEKPPVVKDNTPDPVVEELCAVIETIMDAGDPNQMGENGQPIAKYVKEGMASKFTRAQFKAAWAIWTEDDNESN